MFFKEEFEHTVMGVKGRMFRWIAKPGDKPRLLQRWQATHRIGKKVTSIQINYGDQHNNGHDTLSITGEMDYTDQPEGGSYGQIQEELCEAFPNLEPLLKWHLCSTDGPLHYPSNVLYLAGDRDHWGRAAGDPCAWDCGITFGHVPAIHKLPQSFWAWLQGKWPDYESLGVVEVLHPQHGFNPKYTFTGYERPWHLNPFNDYYTAHRFLASIKAFSASMSFVEQPVHFSKGKERQFDAARRAAIWDASDEELSKPRDELKADLEARLPDLLKEFERVVTKDLGFIYDTEHFVNTHT